MGVGGDLAEAEMKEWTHKGLVRHLSNWLKNSRRATIVVSELQTRLSETPDILAWSHGGHSTLIECKTSKADFVADKTKRFRMMEELGVGDLRYFAAPEGLLEREDIPEGWGLLQVGEWKHVRQVVDAAKKPADKRKECCILISALRRLEISTAVYVVHDEEFEADCGG